MMENRDEVVLRPFWRVLAGWVLIGLGALFILLGWVGVATNPAVARQMAYLVSGGIGGLACAIVGVGLLISEDLRSERRRLGRIEAAVLDVRELLISQSEAIQNRGVRGGSRRSTRTDDAVPTAADPPTRRRSGA